MRDYIENACEEIDAALFSGDGFLQPDKTIEEFEVYLERWRKKINEIKEDIEKQKIEERFSKYSDEELKKQYQAYYSFQPIGSLYSGVRIDFVVNAEKELRKRNIDIYQLRKNGKENSKDIL